VNYIELHIGDYSAATFHLSPLEDGIYWRLLRLYYRDEAPLPADVGQVARAAGCRTPEEREAVETILREFFELQADGWHQSRCDEELVKYRERMVESDAKREHEADRQRRHREERSALFAKLREFGIVLQYDTPTQQLRTELSRVTGALQAQASRVTGALHGGMSQVYDSDATATHTPDTRHQTPELKERGKRKRSPSFDAAAIELPDWLDREAWASWCADRKKRGKAITETAARLQVKQLGEYLEAGHIPERVIEHSIASGYTGLFAPKGITPSAAPGKAPESFRERDERIARERFNALVYGSSSGAKTPDAFDDFDNVIDMTPTQQRIAP